MGQFRTYENVIRSSGVFVVWFFLWLFCFCKNAVCAFQTVLLTTSLFSA